MADPNPGIDLNLPACEIDPAEDAQVVQQPVVKVYMSNPIDWDEVQMLLKGSNTAMTQSEQYTPCC
ncbi:hypothetical protein C2845_PM03G34200 [Panicum miliaceum]|uniref:Uncharacterized protein n=1 Tax=Panicum miliaceum TaxID=4540 RepID=A0A3L6TCG4_PANMI|nr:hypothetical protein C2845_PM03G34200 [Panicum miliaceum]